MDGFLGHEEEEHQVNPVGDVELAIDDLAVIAHGVDGAVQAGGDLQFGAAAQKQRQHKEFGAREPLGEVATPGHQVLAESQPGFADGLLHSRLGAGRQLMGWVGLGGHGLRCSARVELDARGMQMVSTKLKTNNYTSW